MFYVVNVEKFNEKSEVKNNITTCPCCTRHTTNGSGIVSGFHLNKDSATALLSQILYETISTEEKKEIKKDDNKITINFFGGNSNIEVQPQKKKVEDRKQIIAFSDSRQQASFFATFFEFTHNRFL